jgi:formylglycine-generating enzyme required for sulfatase activity
MQYLPGMTVRELLRTRQGVLLPDVVLQILQCAGEALDYAHTSETPVVHRDIKPENMMFNPQTGKVHVIDFGLAAEIRHTHSRYSRGHLPHGGTESYMSPEQWHGREAAAFSDQWSLGIVAWELLTGACPFLGSGMALGFAIVNSPHPQLPRELQRLRPVFDRVLQKEPGLRYVSCTEFVRELRVALGGGDAATPATARPETVDKPARRPAVGGRSDGDDLAGLVQQLLAKVAEQHVLARELQAEQHYAEAVAALEEIPDEQRHLLDAGLYEACVRQRDQVQSLDREISTAVKALRFDGVQEKIVALQQLQPWREDLGRLLKSLPAAPAPPAKPQPPKSLTAPFDANTAKASQLSLAKVWNLPAEWTNSVGMKFRPIPAGTFLMGSASGQGDDDDDEFDDERPQHSVTLTQPFWLGVHQVTQGQWQQVMGTTPWKGQDYVIEGSDVPVSYVSWEDAVAFCERLSKKEGKRYRLPTEAEWEWSCRAGTTTAYSFGDDESQLGQYAWFRGNAWEKNEKYAHRVGQKRANPFGLYDVHGNVWEWCVDWYDAGYYEQSPDEDPQGPSSGSSRVLRGGSWYNEPIRLRSSIRNGYTPDDRNFNIGCRVLLERP